MKLKKSSSFILEVDTFFLPNLINEGERPYFAKACMIVGGKKGQALGIEETLAPLGMDNSSFAWKEGFRARMSNGHDLSGNTVPVYLYPDRASVDS